MVTEKRFEEIKKNALIDIDIDKMYDDCIAEGDRISEKKGKEFAEMLF